MITYDTYHEISVTHLYDSSIDISLEWMSKLVLGPLFKTTTKLQFVVSEIPIKWFLM